MPLTLSLVDKGIEHMNHFFEVLKKNYCIYHLYERSLFFLQTLFSIYPHYSSEIRKYFISLCKLKWNKVKLLSHVQLFGDPTDCSLPCSSIHGIFQARVLGCHFLLQGVFQTRWSNLALLHCRQMLYCLSHKGSLIYSSFSFSSRLGFQETLNLVLQSNIKSSP